MILESWFKLLSVSISTQIIFKRFLRKKTSHHCLRFRIYEVVEEVYAKLIIVFLISKGEEKSTCVYFIVGMMFFDHILDAGCFIFKVSSQNMLCRTEILFGYTRVYCTKDFVLL